jgi:hypothetical protein
MAAVTGVITMGLDWIAHPDKKTCTEDKQHKTNNEYTTGFKAEVLSNTSLPDNLLQKAYTNMNPPLIFDYTTDLAIELRSNKAKYSEHERTVIQDAVEWLQYWTENDWCVEAWC